MDLFSFTKKKEKVNSINTIKDDDESIIFEKGDKLGYFFKTKIALEKKSSELFFSPTTAIITDSKETAKSFFEESKIAKVEGIMGKSLTSPYKPGSRTGALTKLKETKEDLDVVIVGAEHGKGKRTGFYSSFLIGVLDCNDSSEPYKIIGKVASGIKEIEENGVSIQELTALLLPLKIKETEDIDFFDPQIIIQVRYQEIQESTIYSSQYALRFPRIISLRKDKPLTEIATLEDIQKASRI